MSVSNVHVCMPQMVAVKMWIAIALFACIKHVIEVEVIF